MIHNNICYIDAQSEISPNQEEANNFMRKSILQQYEKENLSKLKTNVNCRKIITQTQTMASQDKSLPTLQVGILGHSLLGPHLYFNKVIVHNKY